MKSWLTGPEGRPKTPMRPVAPSSDQSNSACSPGSGDPEIRKTMGFFLAKLDLLQQFLSGKWMDMDGNGCHFAARQPSGSWSSPTVPLVGAYKPPLNQLNVRFISVPRMAFKEKSNKETGYWKPRKLEVKTWFRQQIFLTSIH